MTTFLSFGARPQQNGTIIQVSMLAGSNPDPESGDMLPTGELYMQPHEWEALRSLLVSGMHDAKRNHVPVEIMDGTRRATGGDNVVDFQRNWKA